MDKSGVSWEVTPAGLSRMLQDRDTRKVERVTDAFLKMRKFDISALKKAHRGQTAGQNGLTKVDRPRPSAV